ncbi:Muskelin 1, intracellular mediator containing kelch motif, partial [Coemansia erecta]
FKVYGGMTEDNMVELLYSGLPHDQKFNFSVWFVELRGTMDPQTMLGICNDFSRFKEKEVIRSCLKFFRDKNYTSAFTALATQSSVLLESPLLTEIQKALVEEGNYDI